MTKPILFIGHAAERSGPPIFLRHLLGWLRANRPDVTAEVLVLAGGPLLDDYRRLTLATRVFESSESAELARVPDWLLGRVDMFGSGPDGALTGPARAWARGVSTDVLRDRVWAAQRDAGLRRFLHAERIDARRYRGVYVNSLWCGLAARRLPGLRSGAVPVLTHVHELGVGVDFHTARREREWTLRHSTHLLTASEAVSTFLTAQHGVEADRMTVSEPMVEVAAGPPSAAGRRVERERAGLDPEAFTVGMGGTAIWRKGPDLFVRLVWEVHRQRPEARIQYVWVGGDPEGLARVRRDLRDAGLERLVHLVGQQADPLRWYSMFDAFVLPAREDAYPMACLEAASVGVPLVCFNTGGMASFARTGAGVVVPYPDVGALAQGVLALMDQPEHARRLGAQGASLVRANNAIDVAAPRLLAELDRWMPA